MFPSKVETLSANMMAERRHHDSSSSILKTVFSKNLLFDQKLYLFYNGGHATTIFGFLIEFHISSYHETFAVKAWQSSRPYFYRGT